MWPETTLKRVRLLLAFFTAALVVSGLTAIPLVLETRLLASWFGEGSGLGSLWPGLGHWVSLVHQGLEQTQKAYPFLAYGTDWLAFGHLILALMFLGAIKDPVRNRWVIDAGMIACVLIVPWALFFGAIRGIPFFWRLIDMSFGVFGLAPLWLARRDIMRMQDRSIASN